MTGILTVPERLAAMALDASAQIAYVTWTYQATLDSLIRPAVVIEIDAGEYPSGEGAASVVFPTETYRMYLVGPKYGTGNDLAESELLVRTIVDDLLTYFLKRPTLAMSNERGRAPAALGELRGVRWARIGRGIVNVLTRGEDVFWGCDFSVTVELTLPVPETIR